jgi:hypothetical protein
MLRSIHGTLAGCVSATIAVLAGTLTFFVIVGVLGLGSAVVGGIVAIVFAVVVSARGNPQEDLQ